MREARQYLLSKHQKQCNKQTCQVSGPSVSQNKYLCNDSCLTVWHFGSFCRQCVSFNTVILIETIYWISPWCKSWTRTLSDLWQAPMFDSSDVFYSVAYWGNRVILSQSCSPIHVFRAYHCCTENRTHRGRKVMIPGIGQMYSTYNWCDLSSSLFLFLCVSPYLILGLISVSVALPGGDLQP